MLKIEGPVLVLGHLVACGAGGRIYMVRGVFLTSAPTLMSFALRETRSEPSARKFHWSITNKTTMYV